MERCTRSLSLSGGICAQNPFTNERQGHRELVTKLAVVFLGATPRHGDAPQMTRTPKSLLLTYLNEAVVPCGENSEAES